MKKYYLALLVCIILTFFASCEINISLPSGESNEPVITDSDAPSTKDDTFNESTPTDAESIPTQEPITYYHPELGVLPTMEELGLYWGMPKEELVEKFGEDYIDVGSGLRWYEWTLDDEKKLYVWMTSDDSGPNEYKKYYAKRFAIGTNRSNSIYIDEHLEDN